MFTTPGAGGTRRWRDEQMGASEPTGRRGASPRRRIDAALTATPPPKRPTGYVVPEIGTGPEMNTQMLSNELYKQKSEMAALQHWVSSIFEACTDHAIQLEGAARHFMQLAGSVEDFKGTVQLGQETAEVQIEDVFKKVDALIAEVKGESAGAFAKVEDKIMKIENALGQLSPGPAGPPGGPPPGIDGQGVAGVEAAVVALRAELVVVKGEIAAVQSGYTTIGQTASRVLEVAAVVDGVATRVTQLEQARVQQNQDQHEDPLQRHDAWAAGRAASASAGGAGGVGGLFGGGPMRADISTPPRAREGAVR